MAAERRLRAMGSEAHLIVVGGAPDLVDRAVLRLDELEQRWSRFVETSDVTSLNRHAGDFVAVSDDTVTLIERAREAWRLTGGAFDPTVLGAVIRAGYDRTFEDLGPTPSAGHSLLGIGVADIVIDGNSVALAPGTGFDPGGIGKGLAADLVCSEARAAGAAGACINLGGDVRVSGAGPDGGAWTVGVEHPWTTEPIALLGLDDGAVATSTTLRRRWTTDGVTRHHIIDPQTGFPSDTDVTLATVVAAQGWVAEVFAKTTLLAGASHAFDILGGTGMQAIVVSDEGVVSSTPGIAAYLGGVELVPRIPRLT